MPPEQCPECGRFLKNALVARTRAAPVPCPGCGFQLTALLLSLAAHAVGGTEGGEGDQRPRGDDDDQRPRGDDDAQRPRRDDVPSVRPPDLAPETVRDEPADVLAGWDLGAGEAEIARWRDDRRPFPTDTVVVLGAGVLGSVAGAAAWRDRRVSGAGLGALTGLLVAAASRRIWRLEG